MGWSYVYFNSLDCLSLWRAIKVFIFIFMLYCCFGMKPCFYLSVFSFVIFKYDFLHRFYEPFSWTDEYLDTTSCQIKGKKENDLQNNLWTLFLLNELFCDMMITLWRFEWERKWQRQWDELILFSLIVKRLNISELFTMVDNFRRSYCF